MKIELKETKELERELSVEIEPETVRSEMDKRFAEIRRTVTIKGFRKGKAPLNMIKSQYTDQVKTDVIDNLIRETYPKAIQEKNLRVATHPTVTDLSFSDDGGLRYKATVEVLPEIKDIVLDNLELETIETEATDEEVEDAIAHYLKSLSELRPADRPARDGDVVLVDLKKLTDSKNVLAQDAFPNSEVDLDNKMTVREFKEELPGMKAGDEKEIEVKYGDDYPDANFAGAEIRYRCKVKAVKERHLPEFDDSFAKMTGRAETALELRLKIRKDIGLQKKNNLARIHRREVIRQICDRNQIPIPDGMVNRYLDSVVENIKKQTPDVNEEEVRSQYRQAGINSMRWDILWHKLAEQEKIEVLPSDTENWINGFAASNKMTTVEAKEALQKSGKVADLRESILEEKVLDFLIDNSKMVPLKTQ